MVGGGVAAGAGMNRARTILVTGGTGFIGRHLVPVLATGFFRAGDIRHAAADIGRARVALGYEPKVGIEEGMAEYVRWVRGQPPMPPELAASSRHSTNPGTGLP